MALIKSSYNTPHKKHLYLISISISKIQAYGVPGVWSRGAACFNADGVRAPGCYLQLKVNVLKACKMFPWKFLAFDKVTRQNWNLGSVDLEGSSDLRPLVDGICRWQGQEEEAGESRKLFDHFHGSSDPQQTTGQWTMTYMIQVWYILFFLF